MGASSAAHGGGCATATGDRMGSMKPGDGYSDGDVSKFRRTVDGFVSKTDELEQQVDRVVQFYATKKQGSNSRGCLASKEKENCNANHHGGKKLAGGCRKEPVCTTRMKELMRQFGTVLKQISQHKWAYPFMEPVDVEGLGLHDYHELNELNLHLEKFREVVLQKCRKMSVYEKRKLGAEICSLSADDLDKALEIIAQENTSMQTSTSADEIDLDAQSQSTLWKLKFFVREALKCQSKNVDGKVDENSKRKEICDALAKTGNKRSKRLP